MTNNINKNDNYDNINRFYIIYWRIKIEFLKGVQLQS